MGLGIGSIKKVGKGAVGLAKGAKDKAVGAAKDAGRKAKDVGSKAKDVGGDAVELSKDAWDWKSKQDKNFANGLLSWGKDTVDTAVGIAKDPVGSAKAVGKLATNPALNPVAGTALAVAQGKNPVDAYKEGAKDLKDIGTGIFNDYKEVYQEHGLAGLAGRLAPDVATAVLTGGSGTAAKTAGTTAARGVTREAVGETVKDSVAKKTAKDVAGEVLPGPEDVVDASKENSEQDDSFWDNVLGLFG